MTVVDETGSCGGVSYEDIRSSSREKLGEERGGNWIGSALVLREAA